MKIKNCMGECGV